MRAVLIFEIAKSMPLRRFGSRLNKRLKGHIVVQCCVGSPIPEMQMCENIVYRPTLEQSLGRKNAVINRFQKLI